MIFDNHEKDKKGLSAMHESIGQELKKQVEEAQNKMGVSKDAEIR